jgi:hypothetical protein
MCCAAFEGGTAHLSRLLQRADHKVDNRLIVVDDQNIVDDDSVHDPPNRSARSLLLP